MNARVNIDAHEITLEDDQFVYMWDFDGGDQPLLRCVLDYVPEERFAGRLCSSRAVLHAVYAGGVDIGDLLDGDMTNRIQDLALREFEADRKEEEAEHQLRRAGL